jgi:hypothetical protein
LGLSLILLTEKNSLSGRNLICYALEHSWLNDVVIAAAIYFPNCREHELIFRKEGFFVYPKRFRLNPFTICLKGLSKKDH